MRLNEHAFYPMIAPTRLLDRCCLGGLLFAGICFAQSLPQNWAGAGMALNQASKPPVAGWFSYATLVNQKGEIYSFSTHEIFLSPRKPYTIQSSVRTGFATVMRHIGPILLFGFGDAGVSAGGASVGGAFSGGGMGIVKLRKTDWSLVCGGRLLKAATGGKSQTVIEIGLGRSF